MNKWEKGDIIQIDPDSDELFGGLFMVVTEPKSWGAQGYVAVMRVSDPEKGHAVDPNGGLAYYRCRHADGIKVGRAEWFYDDQRVYESS